MICLLKFPKRTKVLSDKLIWRIVNAKEINLIEQLSWSIE